MMIRSRYSQTLLYLNQLSQCHYHRTQIPSTSSHNRLASHYVMDYRVKGAVVSMGFPIQKHRRECMGAIGAKEVGHLHVSNYLAAIFAAYFL